MPTILQADEMKAIRQGDGWQEIGLADTNTFGTRAIVVRRWLLEPGAQGPERELVQTSQLFYVVRGEGTAVVDDQSLPLTENSLLWLDAGESYQFIAGEAGLDLLLGYAT